MMRLMSLKQYMKMSKPALIRKITQALRAMPKAKLARLCYNITKAKLPRLRTKKLPYWKDPEKRTAAWGLTRKDPQQKYAVKGIIRRKKKRKFSRKQLAAQRLFAKRARAGTLRKR